ncbi:MAG: hypothetical protein PVG53_08825, partial [Holophagae bacterium]
MSLPEFFHRFAAWPKSLVRRHRYRRALHLDRPAGTVTYHVVDWSAPPPPLVELQLAADGPTAIDRDEAEAWCRNQTLAELRAVGRRRDGSEAWRIDPPDAALATARAAWFAAPGRLPDVV